MKAARIHLAINVERGGIDERRLRFTEQDGVERRLRVRWLDDFAKELGRVASRFLCGIAADVDYDGVVDALDLRLLAGHWHNTLPYQVNQFDVSGNQRVNVADVMLLLAHPTIVIK